MNYRVGVKRKWFPGFRKFHVKRHEVQTYIHRPELKGTPQEFVTIEPRLILTLVDDSIVVIGGIMFHNFKIYPEFHIQERERQAEIAFQEAQREKQNEQARKAQEIAAKAAMADQIIAQQKAAQQMPPPPPQNAAEFVESVPH